jgi:hypothetical protein
MKRNLIAIGFLIFLITVLNNDVAAQNLRPVEMEETSPVEQQTLSSHDVVRLLTKAPSSENYSNEEEYSKAKEVWVEENPDAYARIVGKKSASNRLNKSTDETVPFKGQPQY